VTVFKVVETSTVTDVELEAIINEWVARGWTFDGIQFSVRESSKRPSMAFLLFTRAGEPGSEGETPPPRSSLS
jgi:hypothetical protein